VLDDGSFGPLAVGLVVTDGAPACDAFALELAREGVRVARLAKDRPPSGVAIALAWLPGGAADATLEALHAWRRAARESIPLVGCAPSGDTADSERALAIGFDDFVAGRSAPREMARRLRAVARRSGRKRSAPRRAYGRIRVDPIEHRLWVDGVGVRVTRTELAVMAALVEAAGQSRSRADLLVTAWGQDALDLGERAVDNIVMRLRRKLPDPDLIVTVRGVGFRLAD
jgi:two-component system phosphate regulon response regulator PhoB